MASFPTDKVGSRKVGLNVSVQIGLVVRGLVFRTVLVGLGNIIVTILTRNVPRFIVDSVTLTVPARTGIVTVYEANLLQTVALTFQDSV